MRDLQSAAIADQSPLTGGIRESSGQGLFGTPPIDAMIALLVGLMNGT
jgi:hypothetical protein